MKALAMLLMVLPSAAGAAQQPVAVPSPAAASPSTRELERINWMELREWVPARIDTVLLPLGTLEPHGVTANGADIIAPVAIARTIAPRLDAMIAPAVPYGFTGTLDAYAGSFTIPEDVYRAYVRAVLHGLARNGFRNIVLINGHGGGQTAVLGAVAQEVGREARVRTLVVNWWSFAADVTRDVFGQEGGHAGDNETAFIQAVDPTLVHPERYSPALATAYPAPNTWIAYPFPSSIGLYKEGEGHPRFDAAQAKAYFTRVTDKVAGLVQDTIRKWNAAGL